MPGDLPHNISSLDFKDSGDAVCKPAHALHAFDALYCALVPGATPIPAEFEDAEYPLFVTWDTCRPEHSPRLRGCIGTFGSRPVRAGIAEYALIAAFRDHRFRKISKNELPTLECGISLLTDFEDVDSWDDWELGTHGINIHFTPPASGRFFKGPRGNVLSATYLPHVPEEQGWTKQEAVDSAIAKAGWDGVVDDALRNSIELQRYQSRKCTVGWSEYVRWREAHGATVDV